MLKKYICECLFGRRRVIYMYFNPIFACAMGVLGYKFVSRETFCPLHFGRFLGHCVGSLVWLIVRERLRLD